MTRIAEADEKLLLWINGLAGEFPFLDSFMKVMVNDYFIPISLSLALVSLWFIGKSIKQRERYQRTVLRAMASLGISCGFVELFNHFYYRPRPFKEMPQLLPVVERIFYCPGDFSFPSNSAAITFAVATAVWFSHRKMGGFLYFLAFLMCFARVYAGVHYPLDIIGGAAIGVISAYLGFKVTLPLLEPIPTLLLRFLRKLCLAEQVGSLPQVFSFQHRYLNYFEEKGRKT